MMKNMPPDQLAKMMEMAGSMTGAGPGGAGGAGGMPEISPEMMETLSESMKNPEMMKGMADMMSSLSPEAIEQMTGMKVSPEQMAQMGDMVKGIKPEHLQMLVKAAGWLQTWVRRAKAARAFAARNSVLVSAVAIIGAGILVRRWLARRGIAAPPAPPVLDSSPGSFPGGFEEWSADE